MKKSVTIILFFLVVLGCAASKVEYREGSAYNSLDFGSYQLGIDKRFEFIGVLDHKARTQDAELDSRTLPYKQDMYVFADAGQGKANVNCAIAVSVYTLEGQAYFREEANFDDYKSTEKMKVLRKGMTDINDTRVACVVHTLTGLNVRVLKMAANKGYKPASDLKHGIEVKFGKVIGRSRLIHVEYIHGCNEDQPSAIEYMKKAKKVISLEKR
jgi:hypothetical protein